MTGDCYNCKHKMPLDSVSDRLHIGNRWLDLAGLAMYDNTARVHDPLVPHMLACDSRAVDYPGHSPFSHCAGNPANLVDMDGNQVFAVHGTFSDQKTWENQDDIMAFCKDRFGDTMFYFKFEWSGGNSRYARTEAANKLIAEILTKRDGVDPSEPITLVGHSHGGNVIIEAANKMVNMKEFEGITINLLTICTPVRDDYQPSQALQDRGEHINVYDDIDPIQVMGGADMKFIITSDPTAYGNTDVKVPFELGQADRMFKNAKNIGVNNESIFKNFHNSHNKVNDWRIRRKKEVI